MKTTKIQISVYITTKKRKLISMQLQTEWQYSMECTVIEEGKKKKEKQYMYIYCFKA